MNFIQRGLLSLKRKPKQTVSLLGVMFLLGTLMSAALVIRHSINRLEANLWRTLVPVATLEWIPGDFRGDFLEYTGEMPTWDMLKELESLSMVNRVETNLWTALSSQELKWSLPSDVADDFWIGHMSRLAAGGYFDTFSVSGISNPHLLYFQEGILSLTAGRLLSQEEIEAGSPVMMASQVFAEANGLEIGSKVSLEHFIFDWKLVSEAHARSGLGIFIPGLYADFFELLKEHHEVELEIVGLFDVNRDHIMDVGSEWSSIDVAALYNTFFASHRFIDQALGYSPNISELNVVFLLHDPRDLPLFMETANEILPSSWIVSDTSGVFANIIGSMDNMQLINDILLGGATTAAFVILSLLMAFSIGQRKAEIGIYLSMGESKAKVFTQILGEKLGIAAAAMMLSLGSGHVIGSQISQQLLEQDLHRAQKESAPIQMNFTVPHRLRFFATEPPTLEETMAMHDVSLTAGEGLIFIGVKLGVVIFSLGGAFIVVARLNPKEILL